MRRRSLIVSALLMASLCLPAFAHEWLLKPAPRAPKKGDRVALELAATHYFNRDEEAEPLADAAATLLQNGESMELPITAEEGVPHLSASFTMPADGTAWIAGHRKAQIWHSTPDGWVPGEKADLPPEVAAQVLSTRKTEKFTKLLLNPSAEDTTFSQPLGDMLEIIPLDNPAGLKVGDAIRVKALYDGKPVVLPVYASYTDFSDQMMTFAFYTETTDPEPKVTITAPGLWFVRVAHSVRLPDNLTYNTMAILMFEVE